MPAFERRAVPNPNANIANPMTKRFFPIVEQFLVYFRRFKPRDDSEVAEEIPAAGNCRNSEGGANEYSGAQYRGYRSLLLFDEREILFVSSVFHLVYRNEMKGGGVNDVASASGRLRIGKDMALSLIHI